MQEWPKINMILGGFVSERLRPRCLLNISQVAHDRGPHVAGAPFK